MNLQHLQSRHKELSEKIVDAYQHYLSDNMITKLKKERLRVKTLIVNELKNTWQIIKKEGGICNKIVKIYANQVLTYLTNNGALK